MLTLCAYKISSSNDVSPSDDLPSNQRHKIFSPSFASRSKPCMMAPGQEHKQTKPVILQHLFSINSHCTKQTHKTFSQTSTTTTTNNDKFSPAAKSVASVGSTIGDDKSNIICFYTTWYHFYSNENFGCYEFCSYS